MKNKKMFLMLFVFVFVLSSFISSYAESNISKDNAKQIAVDTLKEYFNIKINDEKFETRIEFRDEDWMDKPVWEVNWNKFDDEIDIDINVEVDAKTGKILSIRRYEWNSNDEIPMIAKFTKKEAKKIADDFLKRINPNEFKEVKFKEGDWLGRYRHSEYNFDYVRTVNGVDFDQNRIHVEVDGVSGEIISYNIDWNDDLSFEDTDGIIEPAKAEELLKNNTEMKLIYTDYDRNYDDKPDEVKVVYNPYYSKGNLVDAKKGVIINYEGKEEELKTKDISKEEKEKILKNAKKVDILSSELDKEKAKEIMKDRLKEFIKEDFELNRVRYIEDDDYWRTQGKHAWEGDFSVKDSDKEGEIVIDALTKQVISFNAYTFNDHREEDFEPKLTWEEGYDKALDIISKYYGSKIMDIDTKVEEAKGYYYRNGKKIYNRTYWYRFPRIVDGVEYRDNQIDISIDAKTGEIEDFDYRWDEDIKFPGHDNVIEKDKAKDIYFDAHNTELSYITINNEDIKDEKVALVYRMKPLKGSYFMDNLDAVNGKFIDYDGEEIDLDDTDYTNKIKGHWAERELSILSDNNIINLKDFDLDKEITKIDTIKMLVNVKGYHPYRIDDNDDLKFKDITKNDKDYAYVQLAIEYGLIDNKEENFNKEAKITREEMAKMIVKLIEQDKMASMKGIYSLGFKDEQSIGEEYKGYVAVCKGLGIISGNDGNFRPKDNATMLEMAISVYKALSNENIR
ncbi:S-layer homology domain-containing protein [Tepidibacter formicigenes]|uniref:S-layer homology domain-containing protein n=1 Tax=Tepidibacter formicigenes DSM 15518 TaxID=1123349 RepID=A0A1M6QRE9_9FIRM|nr:S-layer homology domain-containing protein [Tepidibacter formicigenes]SHK22755.1 S-layer homology domain-containing protein [Tepidibacter formicigenes DSM 15518]